MNVETVRLFVESWTSCWTLVFGLGYLGGAMSHASLTPLIGRGTARLMIGSSMLAVVALCGAGFPTAALSITGWTIGISLIRRMVVPTD